MLVGAVLTPRRHDLAAILFLALVTVAFFWKVLLTSDFTLLAHYDNSVQCYVYYRFAAQWVRQGILPLWDPYVYGGHSFIGEGPAGVFYPLNLLLAFLIPAGRELAPADLYRLAAVHGFLAAIFAYALARVLGMSTRAALVTGLLYSFAGVMARRVLIHFDIYEGFIWLPLLLALFHLAVTRRGVLFAVAGGLVLGMTALAGHLAPPVYSAVTLSLYAAYLTYAGRRQRGWARLWPLLMLAVAAVFAAGLSAIQMLPSLEYAQLVYKWTGLPLIDPIPGAQNPPYWASGELLYFPLQSMVSFLMPHVFEPPERSVYFGVVALVLVVLGVTAPRRGGSRFFALLALAAFLFALGGQSIIHQLTWLLVPFINRVRVPPRSMFTFSLAIALLAGWGMETLLAKGRRSRRIVAAAEHYGGIALALTGGVAVIASVLAGLQTPAPSLDPLYLFLFMAVLAWIAVALWRRGPARAWYGIAVAILLFDILSYGTANFPAISDFDNQVNFAPEVLYRETGAIRFLKAQPGYFRVENRGDVLPPNFGEVWQISGVMGYDNTIARDYLDMRRLGWLPGSRLYDMLNIRYIVTTDTITTLPLVYDGDLAAGDLKIYENPSALPRAWLVHQAEQVAYGPQTWARLAQPGFDPATLAIVAAPLPAAVGGSGGTVRITAYTLHAIALEVETPSAALLVTSENYYPGWTVEVDGQAAEVVRVNGGLRGVAMAAGRHAVVFSYQPRSFQVGAVVTVLALFAAALLAVIEAVRRVVGRRPAAREGAGEG